jgi:predicted protein tyrosine phosphatase
MEEKEMKKVYVWSKPQFNDSMEKMGFNDQNIEERENIAIISINDTAGKWAKSWFDSDHSNVLRLWFDDVESDMDLWSPTNRISVKAFTEEQGHNIFDFINKNKDKKNFIIHCSAGISRSGAVGLFINDYLGLDYALFKIMNPHILPNGLISRTLNKIARESNMN